MPPRDSAPTLLVIIDGLADRPIRALGGRTPLQAATTPTFDRLAREGQTGLADPVAPGVVADTAAGTLALLGQAPMALKRGPVEALGAEIKLSPGDIALRGNFVSLDPAGNVIDRRAGRIRAGTEKLAKVFKIVQESGISILIFPEAERTSGEMLPFKDGAAYVAIKAGVPIVPIVIHNASDVLPKGAFFVRPAPVQVDVLPPVSHQRLDDLHAPMTEDGMVL